MPGRFLQPGLSPKKGALSEKIAEKNIQKPPTIVVVFSLPATMRRYFALRDLYSRISDLDRYAFITQRKLLQ